MSWFLYVLRCADDTLYTGIATDVSRRVDEHNTSSRGARYTRARRPVEAIASWQFEDRSAASSAEYAFKRLRRTNKLAVLAGDEEPPDAFDAASRVQNFESASAS